MKDAACKMPSGIYEARSFKSYNKSAFIKYLKQIRGVLLMQCVKVQMIKWRRLYSSERLFLDEANIHAPIQLRRRK